MGDESAQRWEFFCKALKMIMMKLLRREISLYNVAQSSHLDRIALLRPNDEIMLHFRPRRMHTKRKRKAAHLRLALTYEKCAGTLSWQNLEWNLTRQSSLEPTCALQVRLLGETQRVIAQRQNRRNAGRRWRWRWLERRLLIEIRWETRIVIIIAKIWWLITSRVHRCGCGDDIRRWLWAAML